MHFVWSIWFCYWFLALLAPFKLNNLLHFFWAINAILHNVALFFSIAPKCARSTQKTSLCNFVVRRENAFFQANKFCFDASLGKFGKLTLTLELIALNKVKNFLPLANKFWSHFQLLSKLQNAISTVPDYEEIFNLESHICISARKKFIVFIFIPIKYLSGPSKGTQKEFN